MLKWIRKGREILKPSWPNRRELKDKVPYASPLRSCKIVNLERKSTERSSFNDDKLENSDVRIPLKSSLLSAQRVPLVTARTEAWRVNRTTRGDKTLNLTREKDNSMKSIKRYSYISANSPKDDSFSAVYRYERVWGSGTLNPSNPPVTNSSTIAAIVTSLGGPLAAIGIVRLSGRKQQKQMYDEQQQKQMYDEQQQKQKDWASIGSGVRSQQFISCMIVLINAIKIVGK
nr:tRNA modification GTPase MnmE [Ipomoea batatas]